jgi:glycosyltransferase involved in cell wall biosynthesis
MSRIKVLHIIQSLEIGGAERLVFDIINSMEGNLCHSEVCCLDSVGILGKRLVSADISVTCMDRRQGIDWRLIWNLRKFLKNRSVDIIHAHQYTAFFYAAIANGLQGKLPLIYTEHGRFYPEKTNYKRFAFDPFLARLASALVSISEATKRAMVEFDNFPEKRIRVIYNGTKFRNRAVNRKDKRESLNISTKDFLIATAARLDPIKNLIMMVQAMKTVVREAPECKLVIMGNGPEYRKLDLKINDEGLTDSVYLLGYRDDVEDIFLASDLFLLSSFSEGTSMTLLEAMNAALPAVVTNVGGNPEIIEDGETGFLVESDDALGMAEKILFFYRNRDIAINFGKAGQKRVRERFSFDRMIKEYEELYIRCVE